MHVAHTRTTYVRAATSLRVFAKGTFNRDTHNQDDFVHVPQKKKKKMKRKESRTFQITLIEFYSDFKISNVIRIYFLNRSLQLLVFERLLIIPLSSWQNDIINRRDCRDTNRQYQISVCLLNKYHPNNSTLFITRVEIFAIILITSQGDVVKIRWDIEIRRMAYEIFHTCLTGIGLTWRIHSTEAFTLS